MTMRQTVLLILPWLALAPGCRRSDSSNDSVGKEKPTTPPAQGVAGKATLVFPSALHVEDESVNRFIDEALRVSTGRDYDAFRLLWVTADEPFAREQFERGWKSLRILRVEVLQKIRDPADQSILYGLYATAELDASDLPVGQEPSRRVVLEIRREQDQWRLANAREEIRRAIIDLYAQAHPSPGLPAAGAGGP